MFRIFSHFLIATSTFIGTSSAKKSQPYIEHAVTPKSAIAALIGQQVTISCLSQDGSPLDACQWERRPPLNGKRYFVNINRSGKIRPMLHVNNSSGLDCNCTYEYSGVGLDKGDCSMTIQNVSEFHMKKWECLLSGKLGKTWIGSLYVESHVAAVTLIGTTVITSSAKEIQRYIEHALIPKSEISAVMDHPVTISCLSQDESPLDGCQWERRPPLNGKRYFVNINRSGRILPMLDVNNPPEFNGTYEYSGAGLDKGDCSITIRNINKFHMKKWECLLSGKNGETWIGSLYVESYETIHKPYFNEVGLLDKIIYDKTRPRHTNVTCCADDRDHSIYLNIFMIGPILTKDYILQAAKENSLEINVTFRANPIPNFTWYLYSDDKNNGLLEVISNYTKYAMHFYHLYGDKYAASMRILDVEKKDYRRMFKLRLWNEHGSKEIDVRVHSPDKSTDANEDFWIIILLIGLGIGILCRLTFFVVWKVIRSIDGSRALFSPSLITKL